jgi:hypothetical protein
MCTGCDVRFSMRRILVTAKAPVPREDSMAAARARWNGVSVSAVRPKTPRAAEGTNSRRLMRVSSGGFDKTDLEVVVRVKGAKRAMLPLTGLACNSPHPGTRALLLLEQLNGQARLA